MMCPVCKGKKSVIRRKRLGVFTLWFCPRCQIGFTHPVPKTIGSYYADGYWHAPGILGKAKEFVFWIAQKRRIGWVQKYVPSGNILDVGAGLGIFGREMGIIGYDVTSIDAYYATKTVQKLDFCVWKTKNRFDAIVFWESFEHVRDPLAYLQKAKSLLKPNGMIFIEYPRYGCWESGVFGRYWYDLDIPRHLFHFTKQGIERLVKKHGFTLIRHTGIMAWDYAPWGLAQSMLSSVLREPPYLTRRDMSVPRLILLLPFLCIGGLVEIVLWVIGQSPINLMIAKKT